ncbi:MAG: hypothetical protein WBK28_01180, partial [Minisyncoccia bacterium]
VWQHGGHSFEGIIGGSGHGTGGVLEFQRGSDPDRNPLHGRAIVKLDRISQPIYQEHRGENVKYGGSTLYAAYDAEGRLFLIEKLGEGNTLDEFRDRAADKKAA